MYTLARNYDKETHRGSVC